MNHNRTITDKVSARDLVRLVLEQLQLKAEEGIVISV